jgi:hypothetical protein
VRPINADGFMLCPNVAPAQALPPANPRALAGCRKGS